MRAIKLMQPKTPHWKARVVTCSGLNGKGLPELWAAILEHRQALEAGGAWEARREAQRVRAMWRSFEDQALDALKAKPEVATELADLSGRVEAGDISPEQAARQLLSTAFASAALTSDM